MTLASSPARHVDRYADAHVGIIMLNTRFPRFAGDIGNPESFRCRTSYRVVKAATTQAVVTDLGIAPVVASSILAAAEQLQASKVDLILTSCGFLGELQDQIRTRVDVPVISSSLVLLPLLRTLYGSDASVGIATIDSQRLSSQHLQQSANDDHLELFGMQHSRYFYPMISQDQETVDFDSLQQEVVSSVSTCAREKKVAALLLECTNLAPFKADLRQSLGIAVYDLMDAAHWMLESRYGGLKTGGQYTN